MSTSLWDKDLLCEPCTLDSEKQQMQCLWSACDPYIETRQEKTKQHKLLTSPVGLSGEQAIALAKNSRPVSFNWRKQRLNAHCCSEELFCCITKVSLTNQTPHWGLTNFNQLNNRCVGKDDEMVVSLMSLAFLLSSFFKILHDEL